MSDTHMADDEIIVHIEPELDADLGGGAGTGDGTKKVVEPIADLKEQFQTMQGQLSTANQRAVSAETELQRTQRDAEDARKRAEALETDLIDTRKGTVDQGITAAKDQLKAARLAHKTAFEAGDSDGLADAQEMIARATNTISRLEEAKDDLATAKPAKREPEQPRAQPQPTDAVERVAATLTPKSAAWVRAHSDYVTDPKKNARMIAAHQMSVADDIAPDTPEYFQYIEKFLGLDAAPAKVAQPVQQRRPSAPTAPTADAAGGRSGPVTVSLKPHEAKSATDGTLVWNYDDPSPQKRFKKGEPIGVQEMARRKMIMQQQGLYDKSLTE